MPQNSHLWIFSLSPSFHQTHLAAPPSLPLPPRGESTLTLPSAADIRAHPPHFSPCTWEIYTRASVRTGYVLRFQNMDPILFFCVCYWFSNSAVTICALLCLRVLYFGEVCVESIDSSLDVYSWMFFNLSSQWLSSGAAGDVAPRSGRPTAKVWRVQWSFRLSVPHRALDLQLPINCNKQRMSYLSPHTLGFIRLGFIQLLDFTPI